MVACIPNEVLIEGVSDSNDTMKKYQRSRQFKLRAVLYSVCGEASLLVKTVTQWSAVPQSASGGGGQGQVNGTARSAGAAAPTTVTFPTTSKELVVPSNTLQYGTYDINTVVVCIAAKWVTLNNASDYRTSGLYWTPNPNPNHSPLVHSSISPIVH